MVSYLRCILIINFKLFYYKTNTTKAKNIFVSILQLLIHILSDAGFVVVLKAIQKLIMGWLMMRTRDIGTIAKTKDGSKIEEVIKHVKRVN